MLWVRGLIFTAIVPGALAYFLPRLFEHGIPRWRAGWLLIVPGILIYALCLIRFLSRGGTPAIFFTRPLRFLIGQEPDTLIATGLYRFSRNPMYLGVLLIVFGQAILFASPALAAYGLILFACFEVVVILIEEPHLRKRNGELYERYRSTVPRWFGWRN
jgi:protein-S-isoprenylcysteine O-methyltransferase Ste14